MNAAEHPAVTPNGRTSMIPRVPESPFTWLSLIAAPPRSPNNNDDEDEEDEDGDEEDEEQEPPVIREPDQDE